MMQSTARTVLSVGLFAVTAAPAASAARDIRTERLHVKPGATGADLSQADGNMTFRATKEADLYKIQAGDERYEIPEAVIFGG